MSHGQIWLVSGVPGAGKSTIARALCARYRKAIHIPVDDLRGLVIPGPASVVEWTDETTRQFALARRTAARMAADYSDEDFVVVIDDVVREEDMDQFSAYLAERPLTKVLLVPRLDVVLARNRNRTNKPFDTSVLEPEARRLYGPLLVSCREDRSWIALDTTDLDVEESVTELQHRVAQAR